MRLLSKTLPGIQLNEHTTEPGDIVFRHACQLGLEGIVSKRLGSKYDPATPTIGSSLRTRAGREAGSRGRLGQTEMAIHYRSHFAYRIDAWDADGENVIEHLAGVEDLQVAMATYLAACQRWPGTPITLRQGTRVICAWPALRLHPGRTVSV
jgi:hypothetical protein